MKKIIKPRYLNILFLIAIIITMVPTSNAQQIKPTSSGYAPANGTKVYYEVYGDGEPIVLLHGAYYTIAMNWGELIPELAKTRKVIALELQGHGHTPYSERALSRATLASDVEQVMDHLKIDSADIVGYSFGGQIAYQFAIQSPKRLKKLVIISSVHKSEGWVPEVRGAFKNMKPEFFANSPLQAAYDAVAPDKTKWNKFLEQMIASAGEPFNLGDDNIAKITAPVLIISGDNDGMDKIELAKTYKLLGGGISAGFQPMPKSHLAIVPNESHVSLMKQTKKIFEYLDNFLQ
ncbi:alpha/beta hydrolase [Pseudoflavitalea sp. G-6-1-2]|uniref:alpha/beta fold hydrolase n=1 Tax=Pseudoflavitalea sp. G-6-1-2 TaxID=2728841 RepID=UPI00146D4FC0|nr:alpha/beta hydrolase [Pseudoflavitalea sp. G-6-1-2]NML23525.1 alpha/beta hydrolase [Pseudoflavitalea sp. G-6-1-2]